MSVQFGVIYYSIKLPNGRITAPYEAPHNGLYERYTSASKWRVTNINLIRKTLKSATKPSEIEALNERLADWEGSKIIPVQVIEQSE